MEGFSLTLSFLERSELITARDFSSSMDSLLRWLSLAERMESGRASRTVWMIRDMHHSTPTLVLVPDAPSASAVRAVRRIHENVRSWANAPHEVNLIPEEEDILRTMSALADRLDIVLSLDDPTDGVRLISTAATTVAKLRSMDMESSGVIEGMLESVTVHERRECSIWDTQSGRRVRVTFDPDMLDIVRSLFGCRVYARGRIVYNLSSPVRLRLEDLQAAPERSEMPISHLFDIGREWFDDFPSGELSTRMWTDGE